MLMAATGGGDMRADITVNGVASTAGIFVGWAPVPGQVRLNDLTGVTGPVTVRLRNQKPTQGGQLAFYTGTQGAVQAQPQLDLTLPQNGGPIDFRLGGQFQRPSSENGDAVVEIVNTATNQTIGLVSMMVRIRKNATSLSTAERNRFRSAYAILNNRGMGKYADFRSIHTLAGDPEAHGNAGFLAWHRAFILDLERELQAIDPSVTLPYWRFDQPAPSLFTRDFMGVADPQTGRVQFSTDNPLQFWVTDGVPGIVRRPRFNTQSQFASVISETDTIALGEPGPTFARFRRMEGDPHGFAHTSFNGSLSQIPTAAKDPLFFMLHANVDRLWAKWQWIKKRFDVTSTSSYTFLNQAGSPGATRIGHNLKDTMWPWNGITGNPRPPTAPGGTFAPSVFTGAPGLTPTVGNLIDYQGVKAPGSRLGFDYDDVPFQF
jgi:tyrosinase